jgi:hypothetical protein
MGESPSTLSKDFSWFLTLDEGTRKEEGQRDKDAKAQSK